MCRKGRRWHFPDIQSIGPCNTDRDDRFEENEENHVWASRFPTDSIVKSWVTTSFGRIAVVGGNPTLQL